MEENRSPIHDEVLLVTKQLQHGKGSAVEVNTEKCHRLALLLKSMSIPIDREDSSLPDLSRAEIGNFYLFIVAICHQTSPRGKLPLEGMVGGHRLRGWDYLSSKFEEEARTERMLLRPSRWATLTGDELSALLRDSELGNRLSDPEGRAELIRNLGSVMRVERWLWFEDLYQLCRGRAATGKPNLLDTLAKLHAYRDPLQKKSLFLLSLMRNAGLWEYPDDDQLGPPVDYHEVRGHLRIGTVMVNDSNLRRKLRNSIPVTGDDDLEIRSAVYNAIMMLSELTCLRNPSQLHYMFWNVFRSCCKHESPHCKACPTDCSLPSRYVPMAIQPTGYRQCPFSSVCASVNTARRYQEHIFETDYY